MKIKADLTPSQYQLILALLREEVMLDRMGEKYRAAKTLTKLEAPK
jgi:hypothetical protein